MFLSKLLTHFVLYSVIVLTPCLAQRVINPGDNIQAAVDSSPEGTIFTIKTGTHRLQQIRPKNRTSFIGEPGAVLNGSKVISSFSRQGSYWVATGQSQQGQVHGVCEAGWERCNRPEELFLDSVRLHHVSSPSAVGPGRWFMDYDNDRLYMGDDPSGRVVEAAVQTFAFNGSASDVTIRGLVIEKYANPAQHGAINGKEGTIGAVSQRWMIEDTTIRLNHGAGISIGNEMTVRRCHIVKNGQIGFSGEYQRVMRNVLVEDTEIASNNQAGFHAGWEAGGTKFLTTERLILRRNHVHHNIGPGLWADADNIDVLYDGNLVEDNSGIGIFHEISYAAVIRNNIVRRNGKGYDAWLWGAQILIAASPNVEIHNNTVEVDTPGGDGITLIQQNRGGGKYGPCLVTNTWVHHNTITFRGTIGNTGGGADYGHQTFYGGTNRFDYNTYRLANTSGAYFMWANGTTNWSGFRAQGHEANGTLSGLTQADNVAPVISQIQTSNVASTAATITWSTNEPASAQAEYGLSSNYGTLSPVQNAGAIAHRVSLTGLQAGTQYHFRVKSSDASGNSSTSSNLTFTTSSQTTPAPVPAPVPPVPPGTAITSVMFDSTVARSGHGDNWHMTWAGDDHQYTALGDGKGWENNAEYNTRVYRLTGTPAAIGSQFLNGYPVLPYATQRWYGYGLLGINDHLYHFIGNLEPGSSRQFNGAKLVYSPDNGATWKNADGSAMSFGNPASSNMFTFNAPGRAFSVISVLQHGKNYQDNTDGYVYIYSPNGNTDETMRQLVMARVPKDKILDKSKYEFFVSRNADGSANWSPQIENRKMVHQFPAGWVAPDLPYSWTPSVVYNKALGVFMMTAAGTGKNGGVLFNSPSYLGIYTAPKPWGPWTQVYENTAWIAGTDATTRLYQPVIAPKWIAADGKSFYLVFSDAKGWGIGSPWVLPHYKFNVQKITLTTSGSAPAAKPAPGADRTAPTVQMKLSGGTASGTAAPVSALATDNVGVVGVQFRLNGVNLGTEDTTAPYSINWNTTQAGNGTHTLTAVARDAAGNTATATAVTVTVSNTSSSGTTGLGGHWTFSQTSGTTTADGSGKGNTAALMGGAGFTSSGKVGSALNLNGTSGYAQVADSPTLRGNTFTISLWFRATNVSGIRVLIGKAVGTDTDNSYVLYLNNGRLTFHSSNYQGAITPSTVIAANTWYHVAIAKSGTAAQIYVNGSPAGSSTTAPAAVAYDAKPLLIGADNDGLGAEYFFSGQIDELRIYTRALTAAEITPLAGI